MKRWWLGGLALLLVAACATSPTGRKQLILFGDGEVAQLGLNSFDELKKQEKISKSILLHSSKSSLPLLFLIMEKA